MNQQLYNKIIYSFLLFFVFYLSFSQNQETSADSINLLVYKVSDKSLSLLERLEFNNLIDKSSKNDSLIDFTLNNYVYLFYKLNDSLNFQKSANKYLKYAREKNNEKVIAKTLEYKAAFYNRYYKADSTFYYYHKSFKIYEKLNDSLGAGKMLLNTAILQKNVRDYTGSKLTSLKALDFLKSTSNKRRIASIYNNLGIIYTNLDDYDKSLKFHKKAFELRSQINDNPIYKIQSLNNIGKVYIDKKDNIKAIEYLIIALKNDTILSNNLQTKSAIITNLAYARFKEGIDDNILNAFNKALSIQDSIGDKYGITKSLLHLAEYYKSIDSINKAIIYTEKAEQLTQQIDRNQEYLDALELIAELYDGEPSKKKYKKYILVRDSLDLIARKQKEVFAHIQLETQEKDNLIASEKKGNKTKYYWIVILVILLVFAFLIFYIFSTKRQKQKKQLSLKLEQADKELDNKTFQKKKLESQLEDTNKVLENKKLQLLSVKDYGLEKYDEAYQKAFFETLKIKYRINKKNFEFWNVFIKDLSQEEQSKILGIKIDALDKRRIALREKIRKKRPINSDFNSKLAKRIYLDEDALFNNTYLKQIKK